MGKVAVSMGSALEKLVSKGRVVWVKSLPRRRFAGKVLTKTKLIAGEILAKKKFVAGQGAARDQGRRAGANRGSSTSRCRDRHA